jgi:hypothetical protein
MYNFFDLLLQLAAYYRLIFECRKLFCYEIGVSIFSRAALRRSYWLGIVLLIFVSSREWIF